MVPRLIQALTISFSIVAGVVSCSATGLIDCEGKFVYNPDTFTDEQQAWIQESSVRWNTWVGHQVTAVRPGHARACFIDVGKTQKDSAIGETSYRLDNIIIDIEDLRRLNILNRERFEGVVMHELGHAIGYGHIPGKNTTALMSPAGLPDFTDLDRIACIKHDMCETLLTSEQAAQLNKKEKEDETQPSNCDRKGNEGALGPGAYQSPPRLPEAGIAVWNCPRLYPAQ